MSTAELRSIYSGPIRRALQAADKRVSELAYDEASGFPRPWNTAWGVMLLRRADAGLPHSTVGRQDIAASSTGPLTNAESVTLFEGRRYFFRYFCRAWGINTGGLIGGAILLRPYVDGVDRTVPMGDLHAQHANDSSWSQFQALWYFDCYAGASGIDVAPGGHTLQVQVITDAAGTYNFWTIGSHFMVEDVGPITPRT